MSQDFLAIIQREIAAHLRSRGEPRIGLVDGYDPQRYAARVSLLPEEKLTGWLPIAVEWMGSGWGMLAPLTPGDQVLVEFQEHDRDSGIITKRLFDTRNPAPQGAPSGEFWLIHKSGSYFKLTNDGHGRRNFLARARESDGQYLGSRGGRRLIRSYGYHRSRHWLEWKVRLTAILHII